jgi:hypothetical protein
MIYQVQCKIHTYSRQRAWTCSNMPVNIFCSLNSILFPIRKTKLKAVIMTVPSPFDVHSPLVFFLIACAKTLTVLFL